jgi:PHS family inorganic phosphate transporter-like MFS transporter
MGFFTDAYDLFSISLLVSPCSISLSLTSNSIALEFDQLLVAVIMQTRLIGRIYFQDNPYYVNYDGILNSKYGPQFVKPGKLPINFDSAISSTALCGTLFGQILFGRLGDVLGRRSCYGLALGIMIVCAFGQAQSYGTTAKAVIGTLCFWRFFLGVGVGGDYPLSATIMSEYSSTISRGAYIGSVFAMQGIGILAAAAVTAIITAIFERAHPNKAYPNSYWYTDGSWAIETANQKHTLNFLTSGVDQERFVEEINNSCPPENDFVW